MFLLFSAAGIQECIGSISGSKLWWPKTIGWVRYTLTQTSLKKLVLPVATREQIDACPQKMLLSQLVLLHVSHPQNCRVWIIADFRWCCISQLSMCYLSHATWSAMLVHSFFDVLSGFKLWDMFLFFIQVTRHKTYWSNTVHQDDLNYPLVY